MVSRSQIQKYGPKAFVLTSKVKIISFDGLITQDRPCYRNIEKSRKVLPRLVAHLLATSGDKASTGRAEMIHVFLMSPKRMKHVGVLHIYFDNVVELPEV